VALAARDISLHGHYVASRFPGYPLQELGESLLWRGGPRAMNGATALVSALAAAFFALALRRTGVRPAGWAALALAAIPIVYLNSVSSLDYVWALAFLMASWWCALSGRPVMSGALLGLAVGCRLTSAAWILPLWVQIQAPPGKAMSSRLGLAAAAMLVAGVAWLPVFLRYGMRFLSFYEHGATPWLYVVKAATVDVWGIPGTIAIALGAAWALARVTAGKVVLPARDLAAAGLAISIYGLAFLRLPHDGAYWIPVLPLALLLLARTLPSGALRVLCLVLVASAFFLKVSEPGKSDAPMPSATMRSLHIGGRELQLDYLRGPLIWDHERRRAGLAYRDSVLARSGRLPERSVVVAYEWTPAIEWAVGAADTPRVEFVHLLDRATAESFVRDGRSIYYLPEALGRNQEWFGVDLRALGARPLPVE